MKTQDPVSFAERLRHTIAQLRAETQQGIEDWTITIEKLQVVLKEEEEKA
jgi:hypothetical protein